MSDLVMLFVELPFHSSQPLACAMTLDNESDTDTKMLATYLFAELSCRASQSPVYGVTTDQANGLNDMRRLAAQLNLQVRFIFIHDYDTNISC